MKLINRFNTLAWIYMPGIAIKYDCIFDCGNILHTIYARCVVGFEWKMISRS